MANVIDFANASQTIDYITQVNELAQASGWDMTTAVQNLSPEVASNGMRLVGFESQAGAGAVTEFNTANAADAYASYIESGGLAAGSGAAAAATSMGAGTVALASSSAVPTGVVGVAAGSAGLACAAAAPIFGVAAGVGLYELAPDFWTQVSQTLLPWLWEDLDIMPFVYDAEGNTYISKGAIDALGVLFANAQGGVYIEDTTGLHQAVIDYMPFPIYDPTSISFTGNYNSGNRAGTVGFVGSLTATKPVYAFIVTSSDGTQCGIQFCSEATFSGNVVTSNRYGDYSSTLRPSSYTINNKPVYMANAKGMALISSFETHSFDIPSSATPLYSSELAYIAIYGVQESSIEGLETWEGDPYPADPNTINVLTGFDEQGNPLYEPYQQVALPIGDPLTTNDPLIQPSPYTNPLPEINPDTGTKVYPAIDPYVNPNPSPNEFPLPNDIPEGEPGHIGDPDLTPAPLPSVEEVPLPATETVPDPAVDPSAEPVPDAEPANPIQPAGPTSGGSSPSPTIPLFPPFPDGNASLYHVYNPTNAQLQQFGSWLWTTFSGNLIDTLSKLFNNPMDAVISLQEFYYTPNIQGQGTIRCGYLDSQVPSALVGNRYSVLNCGSIIIPEYWGNYLDYSPYSQVIAYLPFIGFMSLNADDVIGNAVNITYHIDSYTGSVIAIITVARQGYESVVYQFEGNCSVDVPVTGGQQSSIKGAIIGGISGAVMGGVPGAIAGAAIGGLSTKNDVQHSGSFSSSYGAMGAKVPFIVVRRPVQKVVYNYNESYGFPAHKMVYVGNCRGYLRAKEVRVLSTKATNEEKEMIINALKAGVYVKN